MKTVVGFPLTFVAQDSIVGKVISSFPFFLALAAKLWKELLDPFEDVQKRFSPTHYSISLIFVQNSVRFI